jgi:hypothetical protein
VKKVVEYLKRKFPGGPEAIAKGPYGLLIPDEFKPDFTGTDSTKLESGFKSLLEESLAEGALFAYNTRARREGRTPLEKLSWGRRNDQSSAITIDGPSPSLERYEVPAGQPADSNWNVSKGPIAPGLMLMNGTAYGWGPKGNEQVDIREPQPNGKAWDPASFSSWAQKYKPGFTFEGDAGRKARDWAEMASENFFPRPKPSFGGPRSW